MTDLMGPDRTIAILAAEYAGEDCTSRITVRVSGVHVVVYGCNAPACPGVEHYDASSSYVHSWTDRTQGVTALRWSEHDGWRL